MIKNLNDLYEKIFELIKRLIEINQYELARQLFESLFVSQSQSEVFGECRNRIRELKKAGISKQIPGSLNLNELERFLNKYL